MYRKSGYKRTYPKRKFAPKKKSMVLPYGKNTRYNPKAGQARTKKATQQINSSVYQSDEAGKNDPVSVAMDTQGDCVSAVSQGTAVYQCTGTTIFCKSLYVQYEVKLNPISFSDDANPPAIFATSQVGGAKVYQEVAKAKNVRVVVIQDRAPNGTVPKLSDIYTNEHESVAPPNITWISGPAAPATASTTLMLDPDKSRRFKVLMNEVVTVSLSDPIVHGEKYIPLNFFTTFAGNTGDPNPNHIITNGIYIFTFCESDFTIADNSSRAAPRRTWTAKLRFEP